MFKTKHDAVLKLLGIMQPQMLYVRCGENINCIDIKDLVENLGYYIIDCNIVYNQMDKFKSNIEFNINQGNPVCVIGQHDIDDVINMFGCIPTYIYLFINNKNNYEGIDYKKYVNSEKKIISRLKEDINFILSLI